MNEIGKWGKIKLGEVASEIRDIYFPQENEHLDYVGLEHIEQQTLDLLHNNKYP